MDGSYWLYVDVMGLTLSTNIVKINGANASQKSEYFWEQIGTNNSSTPQWLGINVTSPGTNLAAVREACIWRGTLRTSPTTWTETRQDGHFNYTWDAENRLMTAASLASAPVASMYSNVCTYDYMGRRIQKVVWTNSGTAWGLAYTNKFVYDGWNVVAILDGSNNVLDTFTWGTDLSGSMQGAGGVGGLLSMTICTGANAGTYFPCYDGNGMWWRWSTRRQEPSRATRNTAPSANSSAPPAQWRSSTLPILHQVLRLGNGTLLLWLQILQPLNRPLAIQRPYG